MTCLQRNDAQSMRVYNEQDKHTNESLPTEISLKSNFVEESGVITNSKETAMEHLYDSRPSQITRRVLKIVGVLALAFVMTTSPLLSSQSDSSGLITGALIGGIAGGSLRGAMTGALIGGAAQKITRRGRRGRRARRRAKQGAISGAIIGGIAGGSLEDAVGGALLGGGLGALLSR